MKFIFFEKYLNLTTNPPIPRKIVSQASNVLNRNNGVATIRRINETTIILMYSVALLNMILLSLFLNLYPLSSSNRMAFLLSRRFFTSVNLMKQ